jgi:signal transduction histidine kinase
VSLNLDAIDLFVEHLAHTAKRGATEAFYGTLCQCVRELTSMSRIGLLLFEPGTDVLVAAGAAGMALDELDAIRGEASDADLVKRAMREGRVMQAGEGGAEAPPRWAERFDFGYVSCAPVRAGARQLGVFLSDRGGEEFVLSDAERRMLSTFGRIAAVAVIARRVARAVGSAQQLAVRVDLTRQIHERVMQRLFAVSLVLDDENLTGEARRQCKREVAAALADLRSSLEVPATSPVTETTLQQELRALPRRYSALPVVLDAPEEIRLPEHLEPLATAFLTETLRNVSKHARPSRVGITVSQDANGLSMLVENDGVQEETSGTCLGLRLLALQAQQQGGVVQYGRPEPGNWRMRLFIPGGGDQ